MVKIRIRIITANNRGDLLRLCHEWGMSPVRQKLRASTCLTEGTPGMSCPTGVGESDDLATAITNIHVCTSLDNFAVVNAINKV
jgi:hypothetical protein